MRSLPTFARRRVPRGSRRGPIARLVIGAVVLVTGLVLTTSAAPLTASAQSGSDDHGRGTREVLANLFEWNWTSVANECTDVLGPAGYGGVQVAPPQDSLERTALGNGSDAVLHPWWEVYQPVDYALTSRMGSEEQFRSMVTTCRRAGVKVYVDAVINHMTGQGAISYGGVPYTHFSYPGLYDPADFHHHGPGEACPSSSGGIEDFNSQQQVFNCELVGLADLRTETASVRATLAAYLNKLIGYGVSGFRVDAAKHIGQTDLAAIHAMLHRTVDGTRPYWALEVFGGGPGTLSPQAFTRVGPVLGLDADKQIQAAFKSYPAEHVGSIATLKDFGEASGLPPSSKTLVFVQNHDTERNGDALSYKDGATNIIANEFLLAFGYGRPQVYSGFEFGADTNQSPPADDNGLITDTDCAHGWACVDRDRGVKNMVSFHNIVGRARLSHWFDDGMNLIAFSRGHRGWISINNATAAKTVTVQTGLPAGTYCDIIHSAHPAGPCSGLTVTVNSHGRATVTVAAKDAVAVTVASRLH
jgi:alpha-amylase